MINNSYLLGLYGFSAGDISSMTSASAKPKSQPTAPWAATAVPTEPSDLVRSALAGRKIINEAAVDLDLKGASADYRKLFAMYQGLSTLTALADRAAEKGVTAREQTQLAARFSAGLAELSTWLGSAEMDGVRVVQGVTTASSKTTAGVEKASAVYATGAVHQGALTAEVANFQGDVRFSITVKDAAGDKVVDIDLADMGATPRTLDNVVAHMNAKLEDAGVSTRMGRRQLEVEPKTVTVGDKTITLPAGADRWALEVRGVLGESVRFEAPQNSDAVYVAQGVGLNGQTQLLKFQTDNGDAPDAVPGVGDVMTVDGQAGQHDLPDGVSAVRASAVDADGFLWVVADLTAGGEHQPIKGQSDVALMKYDSAGNLVTSRLLGAASQASGFSLAIADDGRIAVAGSVTGALVPGESGASPTVADSFVTVFDDDGMELWTQRRGAKAADEATSVSFGANGVVYVAGRSQSGMPGAGGLGGWDGYLQAFEPTQRTFLSPVIPVTVGTAQFGTAADDSVQAMTVSGSDLYTAGVENGRAIVRHYTLGANGAPTLAGTRDLGVVGGEIAGIAVDNGKVVLVGQTTNPGLNAGAATNAHSGGSDVFVASLSTDLQAAGDDAVTYYGAAGDDTVADVKIQDGKVWITGVADRAPGAKETDPARGYLTRLDVATGTVEWNRNWQGTADRAMPTTLAVASGGASVLDRLGLPQGEIRQDDSKLLTATTALRVDDQFTITSEGGMRAATVTITARDTLTTLARKIETASSRRLKVTVVTDNTVMPPVQQLKLEPRSDRDSAVITAGPAGKDALAGLGLSQGFIGKTSTTDEVATYGLNLAGTLNLNGADAIKAAQDALSAAMTSVKSAYRSLAPETPGSAPVTGASSAYWNSKTAAYAAALARLGG